MNRENNLRSNNLSTLHYPEEVYSVLLQRRQGAVIELNTQANSKCIENFVKRGFQKKTTKHEILNARGNLIVFVPLPI